MSHDAKFEANQRKTEMQDIIERVRADLETLQDDTDDVANTAPHASEASGQARRRGDVLRAALDGLDEEFAEFGVSENKSCKIKRAFKNFWKANGFDARLPYDLADTAKRFPNEHAEACQDWERYGSNS